MTTHRPRWAAAYVSLAAIWGLSFLFIKLAEHAFAPLQVSLGRVALGAIVVTAIAVGLRLHLPLERTLWLRLMVAAALMNTVPFTLLAYGEQQVSSVTAGLWNATTPLLALPATIWLIPSERPDRRRIAGLAIGFIGVITLFGAAPQLTARAAAGDALCLGAACSYGLGFPFSRRFLSAAGHPPVALAAGQLICSTGQLAVICALTTSVPAHVSWGAALSLVALGAAGTGVAYILNFTIVQEAGATVASTVTYLIPVFSTAAGVVLLGERLTTANLIGAPLILAGAATAQWRRSDQFSPGRRRVPS